MRKKILFIYNTAFAQYPILYEYCVQLKNQGYEVYYLGTGSKDEVFFSPEGINVFHVSSSSAWNFALKAARITKHIRPALVHVFHFRWCYLLPVTRLSFRDNLLDVRTVHVANKEGKHTPLTFLKNRLTWFESLFYRYAIALTEDIKKNLRPSLKKDIPVIPLGANLQRFNPPNKKEVRERIRKKLKAEQKTVILLYSGTLSPIRKIDVILQAFSKVLDSLQNAVLVIAGDDKETPQTLINLKTLAAELEICHKVYFTGFLPYQDIIDYYIAADIGLCFVPQTSYFNLQPPTKLFEYLAAGNVVIATRTEANTSVIKDGVNGYLCDDTSDSLASAVKDSVNKYSLISPKLREKGYETVQTYSWQYIISNYLIPYYDKISGAD